MSLSIYELKWSYLFGNKNGTPSILDDFLLFDSGRSALCFLLENLCEEKSQYSVFVNAYTTDVVHKTIDTLGYNMVPYDIDPLNFRANLDLSGISERSIFIQTGLFGFNSFDEEVYHTVKDKGGIFIEDCCNSFGSTIHGHNAGSLGEAAIFSFRVGKALSSGGGALKVNDPLLASRLTEKFRQIKEISSFSSRKKLLRIWLDYLAFEPFILKNVSRPIRKLQKKTPLLNTLVRGGVVDTVYEVDPSTVHKMGKFQIKLARNRVSNFNSEIKEKKIVSDYLSEALKKYPIHIYANDPNNYSGWNYLFYPILLNEGHPEEFVSHLRASGFDATRFHFEAPLNSFPDLKREKFSGTFTLIDKLVVIPNTTRVRGKEQELVDAIDQYFTRSN